MSTRCRFFGCQWIGLVDFLYDHCETAHRNSVREISEGNKFDFTFDDVLQKETFLLRGNNGLYWFTQTANEQEDGYTKGVFSIGHSEVIDYTLKIGTVASGHVYYFGPFQVQPEHSNYFQLFFPFEYVEFINNYLERTMVLYLGDYNEHDNATINIGESSSAVDRFEPYAVVGRTMATTTTTTIKLNKNYLEMFTCNVCWEYIKVNARFCENRHFLCNSCYNELLRRDTVICPVCRGRFLSDTSQSQDVENLLKTLKFPN